MTERSFRLIEVGVWCTYEEERELSETIEDAAFPMVIGERTPIPWLIVNNVVPDPERFQELYQEVKEDYPEEFAADRSITDENEHGPAAIYRLDHTILQGEPWEFEDIREEWQS